MGELRDRQRNEEEKVNTQTNCRHPEMRNCKKKSCIKKERGNHFIKSVPSISLWLDRGVHRLFTQELNIEMLLLYTSFIAKIKAKSL